MLFVDMAEQHRPWMMFYILMGSLLLDMSQIISAVPSNQTITIVIRT